MAYYPTDADFRAIADRTLGAGAPGVDPLTRVTAEIDAAGGVPDLKKRS